MNQESMGRRHTVGQHMVQWKKCIVSTASEARAVGTWIEGTTGIHRPTDRTPWKEQDVKFPSELQGCL